MKASDLLEIYIDDPLVKTIALQAKKKGQKVKVSGLIGSQDAVLASALFKLDPRPQFFVLSDKESAQYFRNDLQNLLPGKDIFYFPESYRKAYNSFETDNANVLLRSEILNALNHQEHMMIVSYPAALCEKVIKKQSLIKHTFKATVGESVDMNFLQELLLEYGFEKSDFVYEPGQFAVRGGIIDIFSFARDLPYRLELFGDEIESIRSFEPESQLSKNEEREFYLVPNTQTKMLEESRESILEFISDESRLWFTDVEFTIESIEQHFQGVVEAFEEILNISSQSKVIADPNLLFQDGAAFKAVVERFQCFEFGSRPYFKEVLSFDFNSQAPPPLNKKFNFLIDLFIENQQQDIQNLVFADSEQQLERITRICEQHDDEIGFTPMNFSLRKGFIDAERKLACFTDHEIFERYHRFKGKKKYSKNKAISLKELRELQPGDYVVHIEYGVGRFAGIEIVNNSGRKQERVRLVYKDNDLLYLNIHSLHKISKYSGKEGAPPNMNKLGSPEWENKKKRVKKKVKDIAKDLIKLYAKRKEVDGYAFSQDGFLQNELESSFIYQDTPDQGSATEDVKRDMEKPHPMDRLVCGDVGFGKTEVAIRAAFKAVCDGKQVAVLVPTTILALQHFKTFSERLSNFPVSVDYINRFRTTKEVKETLNQLKEGKLDILIGTHRIVGKDVSFKDLGLLIIDEEQKFGVKTKDKLKEFKVNVDTLTLTATPIPRTLHFSLMGARDLSLINTPPPNRQPVRTEIHSFSEVIIRDAVRYEIERGGQVFVVQNRIKDLERLASMIIKLVPEARVSIAHGQLDGPKLEKVMMQFIEGDFDVLVSTNIIESGLDIPNANTIIINSAHMFGLSDLHQMRGRVGRSNKKAFCFLLSPPTSGITGDAQKRLSTLEEYSDLGSGIKVAMRDLDIRGAGNLLGAEQSGFINDLGFDMYHKILDEAVNELKHDEFAELFAVDLQSQAALLTSDCTIDTDLELIIPEDYVANITERLSLYNQLDNLKGNEELEKFTEQMIDRFGPLPDSTKELILSVRLRWKAELLGLEKLSLKKGKGRAYFPDPSKESYYKSPVFGKFMQFIQINSKVCKLKDVKAKLVLIIDPLSTIEGALHFFTNAVANVNPEPALAASDTTELG